MAFWYLLSHQTAGVGSWNINIKTIFAFCACFRLTFKYIIESFRFIYETSFSSLLWDEKCMGCNNLNHAWYLKGLVSNRSEKKAFSACLRTKIMSVAIYQQSHVILPRAINIFNNDFLNIFICYFFNSFMIYFFYDTRWYYIFVQLIGTFATTKDRKVCHKALWFNKEVFCTIRKIKKYLFKTHCKYFQEQFLFLVLTSPETENPAKYASSWKTLIMMWWNQS